MLLRWCAVTFKSPACILESSSHQSKATLNACGSNTFNDVKSYGDPGVILADKLRDGDSLSTQLMQFIVMLHTVICMCINRDPVPAW